MKGFFEVRELAIGQSICFIDIFSLVGIIGAVASVAQTGVGIAQAAGAFDKDSEAGPAGPTPEQAEEELRRKQVARMQGMRNQSWMTSRSDALGAPRVARQALTRSLGGA